MNINFRRLLKWYDHVGRISFRRTFWTSLLTCISIVTGPGLRAQESSEMKLWRLDCGEMIIDDISYFSDSFFYDGESATISNGCYLIKNGDRYLLWDAGLPREVLGNTEPNGGWTSSIRITIEDQLAELNLTAKNIDFIGISHFHGDHIGQAQDFPKSRLLISRRDAEWIRNNPPGNARRRLSPWFEGEASKSVFAGDYDVFGDGTVTILATPGHTPGHSSLLVKLPQSGPILMTGDLFHFRREIGLRNVSRWNHSRANTLASIERFDAIIGAINPIVIVQHDPQDIKLLPTFPEAAR